MKVEYVLLQGDVLSSDKSMVLLASLLTVWL
jgi:hypothetical protein